MPHLTTGRLVELVAAVLILAAGVYFYRRRDKSDSYGSQGAVILFAVAVIMLIHALRGLDYHPSAAEAQYLQERAR
jgi:hypothetical protein